MQIKELRRKRRQTGETVAEFEAGKLLVRLIDTYGSKETLDEKILRLVRNDLNLTPKHVTMDLPQTGRLSERGSP